PAQPQADRARLGAGASDVMIAVRSLTRAIGQQWSRMLGRIPLPSRALGPLFFVWLILFAGWNLAGAHLPVSAFWKAGAGPAPHRVQVGALLARVPAGAAVAAPDSLNPPLSDRYTLYLLPDPASYKAEWVALDLDNAIPTSRADDRRMYQTMQA